MHGENTSGLIIECPDAFMGLCREALSPPDIVTGTDIESIRLANAKMRSFINSLHNVAKLATSVDNDMITTQSSDRLRVLIDSDNNPGNLHILSQYLMRGKWYKNMELSLGLSTGIQRFCVR